MATYKVIQDIEAEDKLLGPLTFRQFVYAGACVLFLYLTFIVSTKGAPFMAVVFLPVAALSGFFAWPWSRDQPTEVWALARIRFLLKPRKRIWNQSGVKELVTITAPKKVAAVYTNGLSENEVRSRLKALATTIDSRGWAIKNVNVNMYGNPAAQQTMSADSDRLISMANLPQEVPDNDIRADEDMLEETNAVARQFDDMIAASTKAHRQEILDHLQGKQEAPQQQNNAQQPANYWFLNQPGNTGTSVPNDAVTFNTQVVTPGAGREELPVAPGDPTADEEAVVERLRQEEQKGIVNPYNHWHTIQPLSAQNQQTQMQQSQQFQQGVPTGANPAPQSYGQAQQAAPYYGQPQQTTAGQPMQQNPPAQVTQTPDPAILQLASNDDLNVATLAREANKHKEELEDEVVISLH